ncbi:Hemolysin BL binding component precursor [Anopheles sinensis]|uniref:Hemolysin BL binding component n=1 Tax=Anopheles sinensis TaxID=74873 RepID=A0A084W0Z2_ANOSI|nr:Hemolysin BL binding component precursor [Anopheles sinensis]
MTPGGYYRTGVYTPQHPLSLPFRPVPITAGYRKVPLQVRTIQQLTATACTDKARKLATFLPLVLHLVWCGCDSVNRWWQSYRPSEELSMAVAIAGPKS